jgi:mannosylglycerate hydrolase
MNTLKQTTDKLDTRAREILVENDRGGYTVPTAGLYPYQWNWDSAFVALGLQTFDEDRAWQEIETLLAAQWPDGMVPHIVFHKVDQSYFPGPEIYGTKFSPPSSGYTQPPVAATIVRRMLDRSETADGEKRARSLFPRLLAWHRWFHSERDPDGLGIIAITHPWESGRDNLPDWDAPLATIDTSDVGTFQRRDTQHVAAEMRPTQTEYDKYIALVRFGRSVEWDSGRMAADSPFWVADVAMTMILHRADRDLLGMAERFGDSEAAKEISSWIDRTEAGIDRFWNADQQAYCTLDLRSDRLAQTITAGSLLALYAGTSSSDRASNLIRHLEKWLAKVEYAVPSFDPDHPQFDSIRYWRGPVWLIMNWMISNGLVQSGRADLAERIRDDSRRLVEGAGFNEYYCPVTGRGCGGSDFSWTAAMWLAWASPSADTTTIDQ